MYTFYDVLHAIRTERNFDSIFWLQVTIGLIVDNLMTLLGRFLVCAATFFILTISSAGFLVVLPLVATPWSAWFGFNIIWGNYDSELISLSQILIISSYVI